MPLLLVVAAKAAAAIFIYFSMNVGAAGTFWSDPNRVFSWPQNTVFLQNASFGRFPLVFLGWDSAWYLSIMERGYGFSLQSFTFSPGLPFFGGLLNTALQNPLVSIVVPSLVFGVLWLPLYQLLAERYMSRQTALASTVLLAFSPYLFLFTTVAYAEGALLFFTIASWYMFKKGKVAFAAALAAAATLTRIVGIVLVLPMLYESLKQREHRRRNAALSLLPVAALASWFTYFAISANDLLATFHTTEWSTLYSFRTLLLEGIPQRGLDAILAAPFQNPPITTHWLLPAAAFFALAVPPVLIYLTAKKDKPLALYSAATYAGILLFGALVSTPRFVAVLFPLWIPLTAYLTMNKKTSIIVGLVAALFFGIALNLWISFLKGQFVA